jgi:myo-inositol-1(or 4)-monophosphatase
LNVKINRYNVNFLFSIRCLGSAALNMCLVANGSAEVYYEFGIHCWDMAAGLLIAKEAGCVVLDPCGSELDIMKRRVLCAANKNIADLFIPLIKPIEFEAD